MHTWSEAVCSYSPQAAALFLGSIWQGVLLVLGLFLLSRLLRSMTPASRSHVFSVVLALILLSPLFVLVHPRSASSLHAEVHVARTWSLGLLMFWVTLSTIRLVQLSAAGIRLWKLVHGAVRVDAGLHVSALLRGARRPASLCESRDISRPAVVGFLRPRILLPAGLLDLLSPAELEYVLLHEMEHLRRGDDWMNLLQQISLILMPWNPALIWLNWRLARERELACDDAVLRNTTARKLYAECLLKLAERSLLRKGARLALSALGTQVKESELAARIRRILTGPGTKSVHPAPWLAATCLLLVTFASAGWFASAPSWIHFDGQNTSVQVSATKPLLAVALPADGDGTLTAHAGVGQMKTVAAEVGVPVPHRPAMTAVQRKKPRPRFTPVLVSFASQRLSSSQKERAAGRAVVTEYQVSQPVYAAVRVQGGWLIVQL